MEHKEKYVNVMNEINNDLIYEIIFLYGRVKTSILTRWKKNIMCQRVYNENTLIFYHNNLDFSKTFSLRKI